MRIALAGFQHETNTFAPGRVGFEEFATADTWPPLLLGDEVVAGTHGTNIPIAGAAAAAKAAEAEIHPILWCAAEPSGPVTDDAFARVTNLILDGLHAAGPLDGIYLDLHGAMVTESHEDGEGALLARLRAAVGPEMPIAVSLDLHANISPAMARLATVITIFRSYPHLDMAETGARALALLCRAVREGSPAKAYRQVPFLVPLPAQATGAEPCRGLYAMLQHIACDAGSSADIALGFTAADVPDCGPSVVAYADTPTRAEEIANALFAAICRLEPDFETPLLSPEAAVREALHRTGKRPTVIADVQDNPGAGGTSDTTGLLFTLADAGAEGAILGILADPEMARRAHDAGSGAIVDGPLGGSMPGHVPFPGPFRVAELSDGHFAYSGAMYGGGTANIGPCCVLVPVGAGSGISILVSSVRSQCLDLAQFRHIGLEPTEARTICVKSTAHFRADFEPIAGSVIVAAAPGAFPCRLHEIEYRRLRPGVRTVLAPARPE